MSRATPEQRRAGYGTVVTRDGAIALAQAAEDARIFGRSWWERRCHARVERNSTGYWGRCDRPRRHHGDHALERGFYIFWWSTSWIRIDPGDQTLRRNPSDEPVPYPPSPPAA